MQRELNLSVLKISEWYRFVLKYPRQFYPNKQHQLAASFRYWFSDSEIETFKSLDRTNRQHFGTPVFGYEIQQLSMIIGVSERILSLACYRAIGEIYHEQSGEGG